MIERKIEQLLEKYKLQCECDFTLYNHLFECIATTCKNEDEKNVRPEDAVVSFEVANENYHLVTDDKRNKGFLMLIAIACKNRMEEERLQLTSVELLHHGLYEQCTSDELDKLNAKFPLGDQEHFTLYLVEVKTKEENFKLVLNQLLDENSILIDGKSDVYILRRGNDLAQQFAHVIVDTVSSECMTQVKIYLSHPFETLYHLSKFKKELDETKRLANLFMPNQFVVHYEQLGISKVVAQLPQQMCSELVKEFVNNSLETMEEEDIKTIYTFFENNLNIAETARQLFVHRNTLIYRLDKYQHSTGLDIRKFEDAMKLQLALMMTQLIKVKSNQ